MLEQLCLPIITSFKRNEFSSIVQLDEEKLKVHNVLNSYSYPVYNNIEVVQRNTDIILQHLILDVNKKYALLCTGTSGLTIATDLYKEIKKRFSNTIQFSMYYIRKDTEFNHGHYANYELTQFDEFIFVDDFVESGATMNRVSLYLKSINSELINKVKTVSLKLDHKQFVKKFFPAVELLIR